MRVSRARPLTCVLGQAPGLACLLADHESGFSAYYRTETARLRAIPLGTTAR